MTLRSAQYLLRFDDLCPEVSRERWERFLPLIERHGTKPILAVIPDNQDQRLSKSPPNPNFWKEMCALEQAGATIAMHGYQHLCYSEKASLLGLHRRTEFAGVGRKKQQIWIKAGLQILRGHGLRPKVWVAPRHGFDSTTLKVLREEGISVLSDGFARMPFVRHGMTWIPQQLWGPVVKEKGLWTICIHPNSATDMLVAELDEFLGNFAVRFTSVERVLEEWKPSSLPWYERAYEWQALWQAQRRNKR